MTELQLPALSLVVLIGVSGSGKSTFAATAFEPYEVLSSDYCRALVSGDENDQSASADAFDVLHYIAGKRLDRGLLTVVDATNVSREARASLVQLARDHDVLPVAIVLDVPTQVAIQRNAVRSDRTFGDGPIKRQASQLRRSIRGLAREGFRRVHVLSTVNEVEQARVVRERLLNDFRDQHGPFDIIGDVHGCLDELLVLLDRLGYAVARDTGGRPVDAEHPQGRPRLPRDVGGVDDGEQSAIEALAGDVVQHVEGVRAGRLVGLVAADQRAAVVGTQHLLPLERLRGERGLARAGHPDERHQAERGNRQVGHRPPSPPRSSRVNRASWVGGPVSGAGSPTPRSSTR